MSIIRFCITFLDWCHDGQRTRMTEREADGMIESIYRRKNFATASVRVRTCNFS